MPNPAGGGPPLVARNNRVAVNAPVIIVQGPQIPRSNAQPVAQDPVMPRYAQVGQVGAPG